MMLLLRILLIMVEVDLLVGLGLRSDSWTFYLCLVLVETHLGIIYDYKNCIYSFKGTLKLYFIYLEIFFIL